MLHNMSILSLCAVEALRLHITLMLTGYWTIIGFQTICDVTNHAHRCLQIRFSLKTDKMYNCALAVKSIMLSGSSHTSFLIYTLYSLFNKACSRWENCTSSAPCHFGTRAEWGGLLLFCLQASSRGRNSIKSAYVLYKW